MMDQSQMMNRSYGPWPPGSQLLPRDDPPKFLPRQMNHGRSNWKRNEMRWTDHGVAGSGVGSGASYVAPNFNDLQFQSRLKSRRFHSKKKFINRFAPFAPRNTTSFIIRSKKAGGITSLVSPCPVTPAVLPTPIFSPSREILVDTAKEEWGVDGYGSMNGLIRLRSPGQEAEDEEENGGTSDSDVEEHVEVERRLDHDLSRFEMIYPNGGDEHIHLLESRFDDQETHIAQLEEENFSLKERVFFMGRELESLRRRVQYLETGVNPEPAMDINDDASENWSENEGGGDVCSEKSAGEGDSDVASTVAARLTREDDSINQVALVPKVVNDQSGAVNFVWVGLVKKRKERMV